MNSTAKSSQLPAIKENIHSVLLSIINLIKKRHEFRKEADINSLIFAFKSLPYLKNIYDKYGQCAENLTLKHLKYIKLEKGASILNQGGRLESYYIILNGVIEFTGPDTHFLLPDGPHAPKSYSFGEFPRSEVSFEGLQAICKEQCELAMISHQQLKEIIDKGKIQKKVSFISSLPFSKDFSEYRLSLLIDCFQLHKYRRNDVIFSEKEVSENIFVVKKGEIKLCKKVLLNENFHGQKEVVSPLRITKHKNMKSIEFLLLGKGQIFGDEILHSETKRQVSALCSSAKASVYKISVEEFKQYFLANYDNKQNLQKFYDSKIKWREGHLHEIKQSSTNKNKSLDNEAQTPVKAHNREPKQIYYSSAGSQPQLKALQRQMHLSMEEVPSFTSEVNSSCILDRPKSGYPFNNNQNDRSIKSRSANVSQENFSKILHEDHKSKGDLMQKEMFKLLFDQRNKSYQLKNRRKRSESVHNDPTQKPQTKSLVEALQDKISKRLNRLIFSAKPKHREERNLSCSSLQHLAQVNKENNESSLQSMRDDCSFIFSMRKLDLFQQSQRVFEYSPDRGQDCKKMTVKFKGKKQGGFDRYHQSSQASLFDLNESIMNNTDSIKLSPEDQELRRLPMSGLKEGTDIMNKLIYKVLPMEEKLDNTAKLHSDIVNYQLSLKLDLTNKFAANIAKLGAADKIECANKKRKVSRLRLRKDL